MEMENRLVITRGERGREGIMWVTIKGYLGGPFGRTLYLDWWCSHKCTHVEKLPRSKYTQRNMVNAMSVSQL